MSTVLVWPDCVLQHLTLGSGGQDPKVVDLEKRIIMNGEPKSWGGRKEEERDIMDPLDALQQECEKLKQLEKENENWLSVFHRWGLHCWSCLTSLMLGTTVWHTNCSIQSKWIPTSSSWCSPNIIALRGKMCFSLSAVCCNFKCKWCICSLQKWAFKKR